MSGWSATITDADSSTLPSGAIFNTQTKTVYWMPQKGQAGSYTIAAGTGSSRRLIQLSVAAANGLSQGPPKNFSDGVVGYVFVHGMSSKNYCLSPGDLSAYWAGTAEYLAPQPTLRTLSCYDGTQGAEQSAVLVAQQILAAPCGPYNKCIVVAHSMGNLIMEHIFTHARAAQNGDPEPGLFDHAALFSEVKKKVIFVISLASAAGGSKAATILNDPSSATTLQRLSGDLAQTLGQNTPATRSLAVLRASTVLAPVAADPGVPFFMVPGYTAQTVNEAGLLNTLLSLGNIPRPVYNGDFNYATLDPVIRFTSRSDGIVDFRSACGIASSTENEGPGYTAPITSHFQYCLSSGKKPNHYLWFVSNMNHGLIATPWTGCYNTSNPCISWFPNANGTGYNLESSLYFRSAIEVIRAKLQ